MARAATRRSAGPDPTVYPVVDKMGEGTLQTLIRELLRPLIARWLAERGDKAFVGSDQFIYWVQFAPTKSVAPDVYVLPGVSPNIEFGAWKVWETGTLPSFALEVVGRDVAKDYEEAPARYAELGIPELVLFDPGYRSASKRFRWHVFRRDARRGFVLDHRSNADRVRSKVLGCWLRAVGTGPSVRVRLGIGSRGDVLVPTEAEAECAAKEAERAAKEAERAAKEVERARREVAEAEVARLRAELARKNRRR